MGKFPANLEIPSVPLPEKELGVVAMFAFYRAGPSGGLPVSRAMHRFTVTVAWLGVTRRAHLTPTPTPTPGLQLPTSLEHRPGPQQAQVTDVSLQRGCLECIAHSLDHSFGGYTGDTLATLGVAYDSPRLTKPALQRGLASEPCGVRRGCPGCLSS